MHRRTLPSAPILSLSPLLSAIFLFLPAPSQSPALILFSNEMIALLFRFFLSHLPLHGSCHGNSSVCVCPSGCARTCVYQSIPKAEQFITPKLSQERNVCFIVYVSTYLLFYLPINNYTHIHPSTNVFSLFLGFFLYVLKNVYRWSPDQPLFNQCHTLRWMI